jgi:hypothetical protein
MLNNIAYIYTNSNASNECLQYRNDGIYAIDLAAATRECMKKRFVFIGVKP